MGAGRREEGSVVGVTARGQRRGRGTMVSGGGSRSCQGAGAEQRGHGCCLPAAEKGGQGVLEEGGPPRQGEEQTSHTGPAFKREKVGNSFPAFE